MSTISESSKYAFKLVKTINYAVTILKNINIKLINTMIIYLYYVVSKCI